MRRQSSIGLPASSTTSSARSSLSGITESLPSAPDSSSSVSSSATFNRRRTADALSLGLLSDSGGGLDLLAQLGQRERDVERLQDEVEKLRRELIGRPARGEVAQMREDLK